MTAAQTASHSNAASAPVSAGPPPQALLGQMINGYWVTMTLHAAARLELADHVADEPRTVEALAADTGADPDALYRILRALASLTIFEETSARTFAHTPLSRALRTDVPGSMHGLAMMTGLMHIKAWPEIVHSVRTGETAFSRVFNKGVFEHVQEDPEAGKAFDQAMTGYTAATSGAVAAGYDFSRFATVVDVGGGAGALLLQVLRRHDGVRGINFDLAGATERARKAIDEAGLADRCDAVAGDFFESVPEGADAYTLKWVLHDWNDEDCIRILKTIRAAARPDSRLLILETVVKPGNDPDPGKLMDVNMLVMTGGRERTREEFAALLAASGFELTTVTPAHPAVAVVEARPV